MNAQIEHPANEGCALPPATAAKHVFLVEDDAATRLALSRMLSHLGYTVHAFEDAAAFLAAPRDLFPAVLVTDMRLGNESGLTLQRALHQDRRGFPVIFISGESTTRETVLAMKSGAHEFLPKPVTAKVLAAAIESGLARHAASRKLAVLSPREREVFRLLARGMNNTQIVEALSVSLPTAKQYKSEVMRKLGFDSLADLIAFSTALGVDLLWD